jgi:hypothetical protein
MDTVEQSFTPEFGVVEEVFQAYASEFAARGFVLTNVTEGGTPPFVQSIVFHFSNARAGLRLSVSLESSALLACSAFESSQRTPLPPRTALGFTFQNSGSAAIHSLAGIPQCERTANTQDH